MVKFNVKVKILPSYELEDCRRNNSSSVQARITKFGPQVQEKTIVKIVLEGHP